MSADSWAICPKCEKKRFVDLVKLRAMVDTSYGKVDKAHYLVMASELEAAETYEMEYGEPTLREDYEIGTNEGGELCISYSCYCEKCGFSAEFNHAEQLEIR